MFAKNDRWALFIHNINVFNAFLLLLFTMKFSKMFIF